MVSGEGVKGWRSVVARWTMLARTQLSSQLRRPSSLVTSRQVGFSHPRHMCTLGQLVSKAPAGLKPGRGGQGPGQHLCGHRPGRFGGG